MCACLTTGKTVGRRHNKNYFLVHTEKNVKLGTHVYRNIVTVIHTSNLFIRFVDFGSLCRCMNSGVIYFL